MNQYQTRHIATGALASIIILTGTAHAAVFNMNTSTGLFAPSERGSAGTTYLGWDTFDKDPGTGTTGDPAAGIIDDSTPDIGSGFGTGSLVTTNGEDHISSSLNYYSSTGSVAETIDFTSSGTAGTGFTTIIMQGNTLFGGFIANLQFSDILGVAADVVQGENAAGQGQFWARWDVPGNQTNYSVDMTTGPFSFVSLDKLTVDTIWDSSSFAEGTTVIPEPSAWMLIAGGLLTGCLRRRRS